MKILFIGNSITLHGKCSYWPGEWGMAASKEENDYVHLLVNRLRNDGLQVDYAVTNFFQWEIMDHDRDEVLSLLDVYLKDSYDYIVLQLGENITSTATLERDFYSLLSYLSKKQSKAKLLVLSSFFIKDDVDNIKETCVLNGGGEYISLKDIRGILPYMAGDNIKVEADDGIYNINHSGVAIHPGDEGMKVYADRLYAAICQYEKEKQDISSANDIQSSNQLAGSNMKLDENKILFVVQKQSEDNYKACMQSIQDLEIPEGKETKTCTWSLTKTDASYSQLYNAVISKNNAKYKIYLPDTTCFVNEKALFDILKIMESDYEIGMLGICGAKSLPVSGIWQEAEQKIGSLYTLQADGNVSEIKYDLPKAEYEEVQSISTVLVATQYDLPWRDVANGDLCAAAQSLEFIRQGYRVVVPAQKQAWCLSVAGEKENSSQTDGIINEYAGYLSSDGLTMSNEAMLKNFGLNAVLGKDCKLANPAKISIGDDVAIGDNCCFTANEQIDIEHDVIIEDNVRLDDSQIIVLDGVASFGECFEQSKAGRLLIGHHSHIESNVQLQGGISIGCGCLIKANSVVDIDIPNHCVAAGNPARVVKAMDYEDGKWVAINSDVELKKLLEKRKNTKPILTIGIPTYNRSYYLRKCLRHIYKQVGNDDIVEVLISDNHSKDNTQEIVAAFKRKYDNLTYNRNKTNIRGKNFNLIWKISKGKYSIALGDDDYLSNNAIYNIVRCLYDNQGVTILSLLSSDNYTVYKGQGLSDYIKHVSYVSTYLSGIIFNTKYYRQLNDEERFSDTYLNQVYIQLEMLKTHPSFAVLSTIYLAEGTGEANIGKVIPMQERSCLANVFIKQYFDILNSYVGDGENQLTEEDIKFDKRYIMEAFFLPWCYNITHSISVWKIDDNVMDIIHEYYKDEPYYNDLKNQIKSFVAIQENNNTTDI